MPVVARVSPRELHGPVRRGALGIQRLAPVGTPARSWALFFFSSRRRHTRLQGDWSSDVCSSDLVNRVWAVFFGRGLVEPVDDFRSSNPCVNPPLLDALAADFAKHGYDLKHLMRTDRKSVV